MLFRSDRKSTRLNSSHLVISYAVFCLKKKTPNTTRYRQLSRWCRRSTDVREHTLRSDQRQRRPTSLAPATVFLCEPAVFFFFNDTATTEIYTLSLHDALPISRRLSAPDCDSCPRQSPRRCSTRSEEHTSELQSPCNLVCRLLLEKKHKTR